MLVIGAIVGWLAATVSGRNEGLLGSIAIGVAGAFIGGIISDLFSGVSTSYLSLTWPGVFWTFVGAIILSSLLNAVQHNKKVLR